MGLEALRLRQHERLEAREGDPALEQEVCHRLVVAERQMALEEQPIETGQRPRDRRPVLGEELPHDHLRPVRPDEAVIMRRLTSSCQPLRPTAASRRWRGGFGCGREAAL